MLKYLSIIVSVSLVSFNIQAQGISAENTYKKNSGGFSLREINEKLIQSGIAASGQKVYLARDKSYYGAGETIWLSAYLVNLATHYLINGENTVSVDLVDPSGKSIKFVRILLKNGIGGGSIRLPGNLSTGIYRLRAYTPLMRNFDKVFFYDEPVRVYRYEDEKNSKLPARSPSDITIRFFPEGGYLVKNIPARVAFEANDPYGNGLRLDGFVTDNKGKWVTNFSSRHEGMGSFSFLPKAGKKYFAHVNFHNRESTFPLPEVKGEGIVISVNNILKDSVYILLRPSHSYTGENAYVTGESHGVICFSQAIVVNSKGSLLKIPGALFPDGVCRITIFSSEGIPLCERMIFIDNGKYIVPGINSPDKSFAAREKLDFNIKLKTPDGINIDSAVFSFAATDASKITRDRDEESILSYLLLTSDVKGPVKDPGYYFYQPTREKKIELDLLLLTHGWRRFTWKDILNGSVNYTRYFNENGLNISGTALLEDSDRPLKNGMITLLSKNDRYPGVWSAITDNNGRFTFKGMLIPDTLVALSKTLNAKGKPVDSRLLFDKTGPVPASQKIYQAFPPVYSDNLRDYMINSRQWTYLDSAYNPENIVMLNSVEVKAKKMEEKTRESYNNARFGFPDAKIEMNDKLSSYTDIFSLMAGRISGLHIASIGPNKAFVYRTDVVKRIYLDRVPVTGVQDINNVFSTLPTSEIKNIEVYKNQNGLTFGGNITITITTKLGSDKYENIRSKGYREIKIPGFSISREFYSPDYSTKTDNEEIPDKRITLYWAPEVHTGENGKAHISFYNSDDAKRIQVTIEGITSRGIPIHAIKSLGGNPAN